MKRTPWFRAATPPSRIGPYDFRFAGERVIHRLWWSGRLWYDRNPDDAGANLVVYSLFDQWRGLTERAE